MNPDHRPSVRPAVLLLLCAAIIGYCLGGLLGPRSISAPPAGVQVAIAYPTARDTPPASFLACGSVEPAAAALYGIVALYDDQAVFWEPTLVSAGPNWEMGFEDMPAGVDLILYVFASDGEAIVHTSVVFRCAAPSGRQELDRNEEE